MSACHIFCFSPRNFKTYLGLCPYSRALLGPFGILNPKSSFTGLPRKSCISCTFFVTKSTSFFPLSFFFSRHLLHSFQFWHYFHLFHCCHLICLLKGYYYKGVQGIVYTKCVDGFLDHLNVLWISGKISKIARVKARVICPKDINYGMCQSSGAAFCVVHGNQLMSFYSYHIKSKLTVSMYWARGSSIVLTHTLITNRAGNHFIFTWYYSVCDILNALLKCLSPMINLMSRYVTTIVQHKKLAGTNG